MSKFKTLEMQLFPDLLINRKKKMANEMLSETAEPKSKQRFKVSKKEASLRASSGPDAMNPDAMAQMLWGFPF